MKNFLFLLLVSCATPNEWKPLLDKDLSQWEMYLGYRLKNDYQGEAPHDEQGVVIPPVGLNKNESQVFTVAEENGQPVLRISGEIYGCIFTRQEYDNYHLKLEVKWGEKKWEPRRNKLKDSGLCYHSIGEPGIDYWRAWMLSQEFQIMEGHMGDYWSIENTAIDVRTLLPEEIMNPVASEKQPFLSIGEGSGTVGFCLRSADYESPHGSWTTIELICLNGKSLHIVNGHVVMVLKNSRYVREGKNIPLTRGKIQIQSEAAEVFYKDIMIKPIDSWPAEYAGYFQ